MSIRIVIALLFLWAAKSAWDLLPVFSLGLLRIDAPVMFVLCLLGAIGLSLRANWGRLSGIAAVWMFLALQAHLLLSAVFPSLRFGEDRFDDLGLNTLGWALVLTAYFARVGVAVWMLVVLHGAKTGPGKSAGV